MYAKNKLKYDNCILLSWSEKKELANNSDLIGRACDRKEIQYGAGDRRKWKIPSPVDGNFLRLDTEMSYTMIVLVPRLMHLRLLFLTTNDIFSMFDMCYSWYQTYFLILIF